MASNFTEHLQLSQWEPGDRVLREDFNADNAKIDAALAGKGNCQVITGTYVGTGTKGVSGPNTLTFPKKPLVVFLCGGDAAVAVRDTLACGTPYNRGHTMFQLTWTENSLSWYITDNTYGPGAQLNEQGVTYRYIALLEA